MKTLGILEPSSSAVVALLLLWQVSPGFLQSREYLHCRIVQNWSASNRNCPFSLTCVFPDQKYYYSYAGCGNEKLWHGWSALLSVSSSCDVSDYIGMSPPCPKLPKRIIFCLEPILLLGLCEYISSLWLSDIWTSLLKCHLYTHTPGCFISSHSQSLHQQD